MDPGLAKMMSGALARALCPIFGEFQCDCTRVSLTFYFSEQGGDAAQKQQEQEEKMKCAAFSAPNSTPLISET